MWTDGGSLVGHWAEGKEHGPGIRTWADGRPRVGSWRNGSQHGAFIYTNKHGDVYNEVYDDGNFISSVLKSVSGINVHNQHAIISICILCVRSQKRR